MPGLATEAATVEALMTKLKHMIPELLELNSGRGERKLNAPRPDGWKPYA